MNLLRLMHVVPLLVTALGVGANPHDRHARRAGFFLAAARSCLRLPLRRRSAYLRLTFRQGAGADAAALAASLIKEACLFFEHGAPGLGTNALDSRSVGLL